MEHLFNLFKTQKQPAKKIPKESPPPKKDPNAKACPKHSEMPLQYLCNVDRQGICAKCLQKYHKGHEVTDLKIAKKVIQEKKMVLEQKEFEWDRDHMELDSLLEKRKIEKLELVTRQFDELETIIKKRRLELESKMYLGYEHERNRREGVYGEKCHARQALRQKIEENKKDFHTDIWALLNEEVDMKPFELNTELEDQKLLEFDKLSETVNNYLKDCFQEQFSKLDSLSLPHDELMFFKWPGEVEEKAPDLKISSRFRIAAENETLKIVMGSDVKVDCMLDLEKWKDIKIVEFRFIKLKFDQDDLLTLHYLFGKMNQIQTVKLTQEERKGRINPMEEEKDMEKNEGLIIEFMTLVFARQQNLQDIGLVFYSAECSAQVLRLLADKILDGTGKVLKKISIDFKSSSISENSLTSLWKILSICHETLESVRLDLSRITVDLPLDQALTLPNLKSFSLMIDYGKNMQKTREFITSSLQSMNGLEEIGITLYGCNIVTDKFVVELFKKLEQIKTLTKLSFMTKMEVYERSVAATNKDTINICSVVNKLNKSLHKMGKLSKLRFGYIHEPKKLSSRQEIKSFINECVRKWSQFEKSGIY